MLHIDHDKPHYIWCAGDRGTVQTAANQIELQDLWYRALFSNRPFRVKLLPAGAGIPTYIDWTVEV